MPSALSWVTAKGARLVFFTRLAKNKLLLLLFWLICGKISSETTQKGSFCPAKATVITMSVYKIRYGTPEEFVPSRFAPAPKCEINNVENEMPKGFPDVHFSVSARGVKLSMPVDGSTNFYGFGLQLKKFQHRGRKKHLRSNADPLSDSGDSHAPVPFFVTTSGFGIYIDTARYASFYCGKSLRESAETTQKESDSGMAHSTQELYAVREMGGQTILTIEIPVAKGVDLYYITGDTVLSIVSQYNMLSGGGCMPPMWGLGCFYRCDKKFTDNEVLAMAKHFRELDIPCDILGLEPGWQTHTYSCSYLWNEERFPTPQKTVDELSKMGFHVNLWEHAFIHPTSPIHKDMNEYSGDYLVWNGLVPDFTLPNARKIFADYQRTLVDIGITGFKLDECDGSDFTGGWSFPDCSAFPSGMDGEQYHSLIGTLYAQVMEDALGDKRTLSQVRNMGALAASYPFVLYSDLYGQKDFLMGLVNSGFSGILWSPEVRHANNKTDLLRRAQMVVFSAQALVNAWYLPQMPWEMHDCTDEIRELFKLRMSLVPYLFNAFYDYKTTGKPPVRALVCDFSDEAESFECDNEYLFGDSMLIAPILGDSNEREVWLPRGVWYDFFTGKRFEGGVHHVVTDGIPVYVKDKTLLPVAKPVDHVDRDTCFEITLRAFGDCSESVCRLVEGSDDSKSAEYKVLSLSMENTETHSARYRVVSVESIR